MSGDKRLKVLHVVGRMDRGGAESRIMDVFRLISSERKNVQFDFLVYTDDKQDYEDEIEALGGRIIYIPAVKESGLVNFVKNLKKINNTYGPYDAMHAHTSYNCAIVLYAAKKAGISCRIYHARNSKCISSCSSTSEKVKILCMKLLRRISCTDMLAVGVNAGIAHFGKKAFNKGKVKVIPNSVDLEVFAPMNSSEEINRRKEAFGINTSRLIIGHVGNFRPEKNHGFIVSVLKSALLHGLDAELVLVGEDTTPEAETFKASIASESYFERIHFMGKRTDVNLILPIFDVFIFPSISEGIPGAVLEAQAAGIPCIVSDSIDKCIDMELGLVKWLPINDPDIWCSFLLSQKENRIRDKDKIYHGFDRHQYTLDNTVKAWLRIYNSKVNAI